MSLKPRSFEVIPEETVRTAFPKGNAYLRLRDAFGMLDADIDHRSRSLSAGARRRYGSLAALFSKTSICMIIHTAMKSTDEILQQPGADQEIESRRLGTGGCHRLASSVQAPDQVRPRYRTPSQERFTAGDGTQYFSSSRLEPLGDRHNGTLHRPVAP